MEDARVLSELVDATVLGESRGKLMMLLLALAADAPAGVEVRDLDKPLSSDAALDTGVRVGAVNVMVGDAWAATAPEGIPPPPPSTLEARARPREAPGGVGTDPRASAAVRSVGESLGLDAGAAAVRTVRWSSTGDGLPLVAGEPREGAASDAELGPARAEGGGGVDAALLGPEMARDEGSAVAGEPSPSMLSLPSAPPPLAASPPGATLAMAAAAASGA